MRTPTFPWFVFLGVLLPAGAGAAAQRPGPPGPPSGQVTQIAGPKEFLSMLISLATGEGSLWISCEGKKEIWLPRESKIFRMDPRTHAIVAVLPLCGHVAVGEGAVW